MELTVFFDYLCPFAYRAAMWLESLGTEQEGALVIEWKTFSLEQQNSRQDQSFKIWEHPEWPSHGVAALAAAKAAAKQGESLFRRFHLAAYQARHVDGRDLSDRAVLRSLAQGSGLDLSRFEQDLSSGEVWQAVGDDHEEARLDGVFGTPTLVFDSGRPVYVKISSVPKSSFERKTLFELVREMAVERPYLLELKKP